MDSQPFEIGAAPKMLGFAAYALIYVCFLKRYTLEYADADAHIFIFVVCVWLYIQLYTYTYIYVCILEF